MQNPFADLLKHFEVKHQPTLPARTATAKPEANKVVGHPDRTPVNKQAALIVAPVRCWLSQPPPDDKLPTKEQKLIDELYAALKAERNDHAASKDEVGRLRQKLAIANDQLAILTKEKQSLVSTINTMDQTIRQLEDLKL